MQYEFNEKEHLHLLNEKPLTGTSSISDVLAKPLTWWASGLAVEKFGWLNPKKNTPEAVKTALESGYKQVMGLSLENYEKLLGEAYKAHSVKLKDTAEAGTNLHAELEKFVKTEMGIMKEESFNEKITPFIQWSEKNVKKFLWSEAHCFDEELWIGGISDAGCELNDGKYAVIDFKSAKEAYTSHFLQDAGYAIQIDKNGLWYKNGSVNKKLDKKIEALIIVPFGAKVVVPEIRYNVEDFKLGFRQAVGLYRLLGFEKQNGK